MKNNRRQFLKYGLAGVGCVFTNLSAIATTSSFIENFSKSDKLWKWSKEGDFYTETPRGIKCLICPNECTLKLNEVSVCHNRINIDNKIYTMAYGNPCAAHVDPVEKKPLYHFLPSSKAFSIATAGCNLACLNCQNWTISQFSPKETQNYDLMPGQVVSKCIEMNCESIAYTYSEPLTFYEYTYDTSKIARENNIKNILVSAGYINEKPLRKLSKVIDAANIDLKSFSEDIYLHLNAGKLEPILNTLKILKEENVWLEITNLVIPSWTDDMDMIKKMCDWLYENNFADTPLHFSRFHPLYKLTQLPATPLATLEKARNTALNSGLKYIYIGNVPGRNSQNTYCPNCKELLIERKGFTILKNSIINGKCPNCNESINGVWE
ncbi:MAG: AmmeMemoRadiSam system radical SAM enzyme [Chlorobi bacterium]|nr:AmmeMemoRadiSam system radical SAM enzyme [Chlorobiota bacterium]